MEVLSLCLVALATVILAWFLKLTAWSGDKSKSKRPRLPPGPWTLPIIGSLHHLLGGLPHRRMMELSRLHGPLMFLRFGEVPNVVVSSAEAAELVMKTHDLTFATRPRSATIDVVSGGGKGIVLAPYGEHWRQMRKICMVELLSAKQVKRMESIRSQEVANLLRSVAASASSSSIVNLSNLVAVLSNDITGRAVFGGMCAQQSEYLREMGEIVKLVGGFCPADLYPSSRLVRWLSSGERNLRKSYGGIQRIIDNIIDGRKAERESDVACSSSTDDEDLLGVLLRLKEEDSLAFPLTSETIGTVIFDIFGAGSESSATTLGWAMLELMKNPEAMVKAQTEVRKVLGQGRVVITNVDLGELHFLHMIIKEVLRLHPPAPLLVPREVRDDCEIMGYDIPKGTKIHVNAFAISRDPRYWENPETFIPERFNNNTIDYKGTNFEFIPFGAGRRQCPGMLFSTSTLEIALANLLYYFDWALPDGASPNTLDMSEKFGIAVRQKYDLQLIAIPST
ncbi:desmethyl-deoxy-podophyllotoxin synthase-like [Hordeum vulgare subsp. vulgare]|uniref:desmethyl-deoxy-podophyllotoxin synthase-like n=1 Tax=Hordeum vulgare subsp. vulgare TaxID=112509 RepID=UPI000294E01F|nr:desmethyl-deoxy-podophyllotoxin synthase-like [Hordeum vulgare subsp. vulgare]